MGKLPKGKKPKRSHYKTQFDFERALWEYACTNNCVTKWMEWKSYKASPSGKQKRFDKRKIKRYANDNFMYDCMTHTGFGRVYH